MGACVGKTEQPKSTDKTELPKASGQKLNANKEPQRSANPE
jgi:hypothetical protein